MKTAIAWANEVGEIIDEALYVPILEVSALIQRIQADAIEGVTQNAIKMLGHGCERHNEVIRQQSFAEFQNNYSLCQWCDQENLQAARAEIEKLKSEIALLESYRKPLSCL